MNTQTTIKAEVRTDITKSANRRLRLNGSLPGTLYSKGNATNIAISTATLPKEHTRSNVTRLSLDGNVKNVLMREVQVDPLNDQPIHFDFQEVSDTDKVRVNVPLEFVGFTREQEKEGNLGVLVRYLDTVGLMSDIPPTIKVDVSGLRAGGSVRLFDLQLPKGLRIRTGKGQNVALASLVTSTAS